MRPYAVFLTPQAARDIRDLDASVRSRVLSKLDWMGRNAEILIHHRLRGEPRRPLPQAGIGQRLPPPRRSLPPPHAGIPGQTQTSS